MARPRKQSLDYFPHDTDASDDEKIDAMRSLYGNDGYAFYFILLERIYRSPAAELDVTKPIIMAPIFKRLLIPQERFDQMLETALEIDLFSQSHYIQRHVITSEGIKKRVAEVSKMREKWRSKKTEESGEVFPEENPVDNVSGNDDPVAESLRQNDANREVATTSEVISGENDSIPDGKPKFSPELSPEKTPEVTRESKAKESKEKELISLSVNAREEKGRALNLPDPNAPVTTKEINLLRHEGGKPNVLGGLLRYNVGIVGGMYHIERIESYMDMMDDALILDAIRRSSGKDDAYVVGILKKWNALKYRKLEDHPDYKEGEAGGGLSNGGGSDGQFKGRGRPENPVDKIKSTDGRQVYPKRGQPTV